MSIPCETKSSAFTTIISTFIVNDVLGINCTNTHPKELGKLPIRYKEQVAHTIKVKLRLTRSSLFLNDLDLATATFFGN